MIPPPDTPLDPGQQRRWELTRLAAALTADGVSPDLVMLDTRDGIDLGRAIARERDRSTT